MRRPVVFAALAVLAASQARAVVTVYTSEADFAAASSRTVQATSPIITCTPSGVNCFAGFLTVYSEPTPLLEITTDSGTTVNYDTSGYYYPTVYPDDFLTEGYNSTSSAEPNDLYIDFPFPGTVTALGFDFGAYQGLPLTVTATDDDGSTTYSDSSPAGFGSTAFVGFISDDSWLENITLTFDEAGDTWLVDRFYIGASTPLTIAPATGMGSAPEPTTWVLSLLGAGAIGAALRRRRGVITA